MSQSTHEVLIDVTRLVGRLWKGRLPTGVDRVGIAYVEHYGAHARAALRLAGLSFVLPKRESIQLFQWLLNPGKRANVVKIIARALLTGWSDQQVAGRFLFNTGHSGLERADYPDLLNRMKVYPIFVVHDLIPITHPEYCRAGERDRHIVRMNNVLRLAKGVIANSQATLNDLCSFATQTVQPMPPSVVGLLAPGINGVSPGKRPMEHPYFVVLSTIEPRKNHWLLLQLWRSLVESMGESAPRLVIIGQRGWECENVAYMLERCEQLKGYVIELSNCSDEELATYLHHAQALLFPSFAEGYGMPLVEALAFGVPVIASDLQVFREVAGEIPEYVEPLDGKRWGELVKEYAKSGSPPRAKQLSRLGGFKFETWAKHFAKVDALLDLLSRPKIHV
jgi:glycosyltransferase involved in cell wall biosynthesis